MSMNLFQRAKSFASDVLHVGPATKGYGTDLIIAVLALFCLIMFLYFSMETSQEQLKGDVVSEQAVVQEQGMGN